MPANQRVTHADLRPLNLPPLGFSASPLLSLNNAHAEELSFLSPDRMAQLVGASFMACRIGEADALLLAFDQDADYDSPNFLWFRARFDRFVYIDRVVVAPGRRGQGVARTLYGELFAQAVAAGHTLAVCEVNVSPPNPGSDVFHNALGFKEAGSATLAGGLRTVRYLVRSLP